MGLIVGLLVFAGFCLLIANLIDNSQISSAEKSKNIFINNLKSVCERDGIKFIIPQMYRKTLSNNAGYYYEYPNAVDIKVNELYISKAIYWLNKEEKKLCFVGTNNSFVVPIDKIEMYTFDGSITYNSIIKNEGKKVSLPGAIVGGAIAGGAGMVIGATKDRNNITTEIKEQDDRKVYLYFKDEVNTIKILTVKKHSLSDSFNFDEFIKTELPTKSDLYISTHHSYNNIEKSTDNLEENLEKLKKLYESELISEDDYKTKKNELLNNLK